MLSPVLFSSSLFAVNVKPRAKRTPDERQFCNVHDGEGNFTIIIRLKWDNLVYSPVYSLHLWFYKFVSISILSDFDTGHWSLVMMMLKMINPMNSMPVNIISASC